MALVKRLVKGSPLTFAEGDANLDYLESLGTRATFPYSGSAKITGSLLISGSGLNTIGNQTILGELIISGSGLNDGFIRFIDGAVITSTGPNLDMTAGPGGWSELGSNNGENYVWVEDDYIYLATNWSSGAHVWTFNRNGSLIAAGNINMSGFAITGSLQSITFDGGSQITPTFYGENNNGVDIVAGPNGYVELVSNNSQSYVWVNNDGAFVLTSNQHQFEFRDDGYFVIPQVQSLTKQAGILSAGDIIIQADESQSWRFSSGSGILYAPGAIEATSFTGSLKGTSTNAITASYAPSYLPLIGGGTLSGGNITVTQNLIVQGTASLQNIQYISQSSLNISTNLITVNTSTPSVRFGGLAVYDSGSTGKTGSMLWDSQNDVWIYSNPSGSSYDGAMVLMGPRNSSGLGNEVGITINRLAKGTGSHHMADSNITDTGTLVTISSNTIITGSLIITGSTQGNVTALSITSNTASLNLSLGSFYTLQLVSGSNTYINPTNITSGLTATLLVSTTGSATVSFPSTVLQPSGSSYTPTTTTGKDVLTFISFDNTNLYLANVKNLI